MRSNLEDIIDELIREETRKSSVERKNSSYYKNPFSSKLNIKKLNAFRNSEFMNKYPIQDYSTLQTYQRSKKLLYTLGNKINGVVSKILNNYSRKYNNLRDKGTKDYTSSSLNNSRVKTSVSINGTSFNMNNYEPSQLKPIISSSKPVNIYSAGASKNNMERAYRSDLNIRDDGGHNLFLADNESSVKKPEFAYKLKRQCFQSISGKPIETNAVAGTLSNLKREDELRKSSEKYFTYPMNIIITSENGNKRSPDGKPKKYYLTLAKTITNKSTGKKTPVYLIRTINKRDKTYSNCLGIYEEKLVSATINTNYKGNFWVCENVDPDKSNFVPEKLNDNVVIRLKSYSDQSKVFSHEYNIFGKGIESLKNDSESVNDASCQWKSEKIRE